MCTSRFANLASLFPRADRDIVVIDDEQILARECASFVRERARIYYIYGTPSEGFWKKGGPHRQHRELGPARAGIYASRRCNQRAVFCPTALSPSLSLSLSTDNRRTALKDAGVSRPSQHRHDGGGVPDAGHGQHSLRPHLRAHNARNAQMRSDGTEHAGLHLRTDVSSEHSQPLRLVQYSRHGRFLDHRHTLGLLPVPHNREVQQDPVAENRIHLLRDRDSVLPSGRFPGRGSHVEQRELRCSRLLRLLGDVRLRLRLLGEIQSHEGWRIRPGTAALVEAGLHGRQSGRLLENPEDF